MGNVSGMSEKIQVRILDAHTFAVDVTEGETRTHHRVVVPPELLDELGLFDTDEERLVRESFGFLLDRTPSTSIDEEFPLDTLASRYPDFADELRTRLPA